LYVLGGEDGVERGSELRVPIPHQKPEPVARSPNSASRFRTCWTTHSPTGCAVTPSRCTPRVPTSTQNNTYSPPQQNRVDGEEVHRQHGIGLRVQKLPPGQCRPLRCRIDTGPLENRPHGAGPDP
jgi:hypothetical protein